MANEDNARRPQADVIGGMRNFRAVNGGALGDVIMLRPSSPAFASQIVNTSVVECNSVGDSIQRAAYFLSAIVGIIPGLFQTAREAIRETGYRVTEVTDQQLEPYMITLQDPTDWTTLISVFGQLALIVYKKIDNRSYSRFMQNRTAAIKSFAGMYGELVPGDGDILLSYEVAKSVNSFTWRSPKIRSHLLWVILSNREGERNVNQVCNYLSYILRWTEMSTLIGIWDTLWMTNSPVLDDPRVEREVLNLIDAYNKVNSTKFPQYYAIFNPTEAAVTIVKSRFKTLAEVSRKYREEQNATVGNFARAAGEENSLVASLLGMHRAFISQSNASRIHPDVQRAIRYLTNVDVDENELEVGGD